MFIIKSLKAKNRIDLKATIQRYRNQAPFERTSVIGFLLLTALFVSVLSTVATAAEAPTDETLPVEILVGADEGGQNSFYSPEAIEKARTVTKARLIGLVITWILAITIVIIVEIQLKEDRILLKRKYYPE